MAKQFKSLRSQRREIIRKTESGVKSTPATLLYNIKYTLNKRDREKIMSKLSPEQRNAIFGYALPKSYIELRKGGRSFFYNDYLKEIDWYCDEISAYTKEISAFISLEERFECEFLKGNYDEASKILNQIESEICLSHWSIEKRLLIAEYQTSFQKNKEILSNIISEQNEPVTNILAQYASTRFEKDISPQKSYDIISQFVDRHSSNIQNYLNYKLKFFERLNYQDKGAILNIENASSIIDKYKSFINTVKLSLSENPVDEVLLNVFKEKLPDLATKINDYELKKIQFAVGIPSDLVLSETDRKFITLLDLYTDGKYEKVYSSCKLFIESNPTVLEAYEIYVRTAFNLSRHIDNPFAEKSIAYYILKCYTHIVAKDLETIPSLQNSLRTFLSIQNPSYCYKYFTFVNTEKSIFDKSFSYLRYSLLSGQQFNPILSVFFSSYDQSLDFLSRLKSGLNDTSVTLEFWNQLCTALKNRDIETIKDWKTLSFRNNIYYIRALQFNGNHIEVINEVDLLLSNINYVDQLGIEHNYEDAIYLKLVSFLFLNRFTEAIDLVTEAVIRNPNTANRFNYDILIETVLKFESDDLNRNISSAILLNQYQQTNQFIWIAFDNFLCSYGIDFPHQLANYKNKFDKEKLIYFLKNIAKQEIYYSSYLYDGQDALDNERIEVCLLLADLDSSNTEEYYNEISEITRAQLIRKGIKQIDESKIYVDVKGIKKSLDKDLRESFIRSQNLLNVPLDQLDKIIESSSPVLIPYYSKKQESTSNEELIDKIKLTSYSRFEIFNDAFLKIRDKFIASNEYGIDTYLSMRIRHGTLLGEIRSVFENFNLITKKESDSGRYLNNTYWLTKFSFGEVDIEAKFNEIFSNFSLEIDTCSDEFKNKFLQIKTESKGSEGLFNYSFSNDVIFKLFKKRFADIADYDIFYDEIIDVLWDKTEDNLVVVRNYIGTILKPLVDKILSNLKRDIEALIPRYQYHTVNELIREITSCQTSISLEFDKISQWFQRTNNKTINDFTIELPINASLSTIRRLYPTYSRLSPILDIKTDTVVEGEYFASFTDIFQILLHNLIKHSHLAVGDLMSSIHVEENGNVLKITTRSNVHQERDLYELNENIRLTNMQLSKKETIEKTRKEGGSGYLKIKKILQTDLLRVNHSIVISEVGEDRIFHSQIVFEIDNIQKR